MKCAGEWAQRRHMSKEFFKVLDLEQVFEFLPMFARIDTEWTALESAVGRVLAETVTASEDLPHFARSTVDGYAVQAASTFGASDSSPALLDVVGAIAMGESAARAVTGGQAGGVGRGGGGGVGGGAEAGVVVGEAGAVGGGGMGVWRTVGRGESVMA